MKDRLVDSRVRGERMLKKWGREMQTGKGKPNILAMVDHIPETNGDYAPTVGAMFSPEAALADKLLHNVMSMDKAMAEYLMSYAFGMSLSSMAASFGGSRSQANINLEGALSGWAVMVHYRAKIAA